jgi:hypothetical protein
LFEQAAKLVVDFGLDVHELHARLERIAASRAAFQFDGRMRTPGKVFNANCQALAKGLGIDLFTGAPLRRKNR